MNNHHSHLINSVQKVAAYAKINLIANTVWMIIFYIKKILNSFAFNVHHLQSIKFKVITINVQIAYYK